jgi:hypothetical protein
MSWTKNQDNAAQQIVNENNGNALNELNALPYYQELKTRGIASGATSLRNSQQIIDNAINNIKAQRNAAKNAANQLQQAAQTTDNSGISDDISRLQSSVGKAQALQDLRKEQANALANKYAANDYSPFLFFYAPFTPTTPLSDVVRTVLYFVSLGLFVGGGVLLQSSGSSSSATSSGYGNMMGGSRPKNRGST